MIPALSSTRRGIFLLIFPASGMQSLRKWIHTGLNDLQCLGEMVLLMMDLKTLNGLEDTRGMSRSASPLSVGV